MPPAVIAAGIGVGGSLISSSMAQSSADKARRQAGGIQATQDARAQQLFDLALPGQEALAGFGPQIANQLGGFSNLQNVGTGPVFQAQLEAGLAGLNRSLAPAGVTDSSISDRLRSGLTSNLLQNDLQSRLQVASNLLNQGTNLGSATNFAQLGSQAGLANAQFSQLNPQAGFFGDLGQAGATLATPALLQQFGLFQGAGGGAIGAGNTGVLSGLGNIATGGF